MKKQLLTLIIILSFSTVSGQVGINTATPNAQLDVRSGNQAAPTNTDGILIPKIDVFPAINPTVAQNGMMVFLTTTVGIKPPGFYYWDNGTTSWIGLSSSTNDWAQTGNSGTISGTNFIGTTDNQNFDLRTNNILRTRFTTKGQIETLNTGNSVFIGEGAGANDDLTDNRNVLIGLNAGQISSTSNFNTGVGYQALQNNTSNSATAVGYNALQNYTGIRGTAVGYEALKLTTTGSSNTAVGYAALTRNTTGGNNTSVGSETLANMTTGSNNSGFGKYALLFSTTAFQNSAVGVSALHTNTTGASNTSMGFQSMGLNSTGNNNVALGYQAMYDNTTGSNNMALGSSANVGSAALTNASAIGYNAKVNASNSMVLGGTGADAVKVGIGTITPAKELEVVGEVRTSSLAGTGTRMVQADTNGTLTSLTAGSASQVLLGTGVWGNVPGITNVWSLAGNAGTIPGTDFIGTTDATDFVFKTNNTERARFISSGFMGIGVSTPTANLDIIGNNTNTNSLLLRSGNNNNDFNSSQIAFSWDGNDSYKHAIKSRHNSFSDSGNAIDFTLWDFGTDATSAIGTKKVMTIDGDGNGKVGIGTVSPAKELEVVGEIRTSSLAGTGYRIVHTDNLGTIKPMTPGTASQVLLGTGVWGNVPGVTNGWSLAGNSGTTPGTDFIGTTDNNPLVIKTNNTETLRVTENGDLGIGITTPSQQLEITKNFQLPNSTATTGIIFSGGSRFIHNYGSTRNFFAGVNAGNFGMTGLSNTGIGYNALTGNTTGENNTALGRSALGSNSTGNWNVGIGYYALQQNQTGGGNIAIGTLSMSSHTTNDSNIAVGNHALYGDISGTSNVGVGVGALYSNQTGTNNVAFGTSAGRSATGSGNIFLGSNAGYNETGSDKLYIDNSNTANPLVYGDFGTDLLRVNGTLNINNTYSLPTTDGTAGQSLTTDGAGVVSWSNGAADNMGNHSATKNVQLNNNYLSNDGDNEGVIIDNNGNVGVGTATPDTKLHVTGNTKIQNGTLTLYSNDSADKIQLTDWADMGSKINHSGGWSIDYMAGPGDWDTDGYHRFFTSVNGVGYVERMRVHNNGNVGIGSTSPTQAKLVINGTEDNTLSYGYLLSDGTVGTSSGTTGYSVYASGRIAATEFNAFSDERIKKIKGISNSSKDLETLNKIQITDYTFKDSIGKGNGMSKKVIAQQVEKVYPQAVSTITDVIPDIYTIAKIKDGRVILKNTLQKGDRVRLVFDNRIEVVDVLQADEFGFNVAVKDEGKVFVFGREVKDFHTVDYEALSTLNISATQELIKIINQQEAQIRGLKAENANINKRLSQTEADVNQIKNMFNNTVSSNSK